MIPTVGSTVHYVSLPTDDDPPTHLAAIVTEHCASVMIGAQAQHVVSLVVFNPTGLNWMDSVEYDASNRPGTWHWPEREGDMTHFTEPADQAKEGRA